MTLSYGLILSIAKINRKNHTSNSKCILQPITQNLFITSFTITIGISLSRSGTPFLRFKLPFLYNLCRTIITLYVYLPIIKKIPSFLAIFGHVFNMLIEMHFQFGIYFTFVQSYVLLYSVKFS